MAKICSKIGLSSFEHVTITTIPLIMCVCVWKAWTRGRGGGCFLVLGSYPIWAIINHWFKCQLTITIIDLELGLIFGTKIETRFESRTSFGIETRIKNQLQNWNQN
jgi:hypothetical protein